MKKLMIAAAIVCAAALSQAASFKWSASDVAGPDAVTPYSGTATLFAYLDDGSHTAADAFSVNTATMTDGAIKASATTFTDDRLIAGNNYAFFYTMETSYQGKDWIWTSGLLDKQQAQALTTPSLKFYEEGSWSSVPEPTSGLLLLLGVAGLALRRRRA